MYNIEMGLIIQGLKLDFVYIEMTLSGIMNNKTCNTRAHMASQRQDGK